MPPGLSIVTPTRPAVSSARARLKPITPNLLAQYAVASDTALCARVEATVTTRPALRSRAGSAARTTAAVPSRLIVTIRSHVSPATSSSRPGTSIAAAVTTPLTSSWRCSTAATASSARRGKARSTISRSKPSSGSLRSSTTAVPPASRTARAVAAPRPDAPPVTITVPRPSGGRINHPFDQAGARASRDVREHKRLAAPRGDELGLGQLGARVVPALDPHVRAEPVQDRLGRVLVEDGNGVHALERLEHRRAVALRAERTVGALQSAHGGIGVQADDQAVAQAAGFCKQRHMAGVQHVEPPAGADHGATAGANVAGEFEGIGRRALGVGRWALRACASCR